MNNEIMELRKEITALNTRLDELERAEKQKEDISIDFDPTEIYNEDDIPFGKYLDKNFYITICNGEIRLIENLNACSDFDKNLYYNNNFIPSEYPTVAEELLDIIKFNMFLTRQKLIYCPDFVPDEDDNEALYGIKYDKHIKKFYPLICVVQIPTVCFPSREIAEKICNKLNDYLFNCRGAIS